LSKVLDLIRARATILPYIHPYTYVRTYVCTYCKSQIGTLRKVPCSLRLLAN